MIWPVMRRAILVLLFAAIMAGTADLVVFKPGGLFRLNRAFGGEFSPSGGVKPSGFKPGMGGGSSAGGSHGAAASPPPAAARYGGSNVIVCDVVNHRCRASKPGGRQEVVKFRFVDRESLR